MPHSPLPWTTGGQLILSSPVAFPNPQAQPMGKVVASMCWDYEGDRNATERRINGKEMFANLDLIVTAVNNHADLIETLEAIANDCANWLEEDSDMRAEDLLSAILHAAQTAIKSAKGSAS